MIDSILVYFLKSIEIQEEVVETTEKEDKNDSLDKKTSELISHRL